MTNRTDKSQPSSAEATRWTERWVPLASIQKLEDLQVRNKLDPVAIKRYRDAAASGKVFPPIKVGRIKDGRLYLVDGWHRLEAGAVSTNEETFVGDGPEVLVEVADLTEAEVRWEAARANLEHGVPLKSGEMRGVFRAFIKAGKHRKRRGELMSYRDMAAEVCKPHTTLRRWLMEDFPRLAAKMGGSEGGNPQAEPAESIPLEEIHLVEGLRAAETLRISLSAMTPQGRWEVAAAVRDLLTEAERLGTSRPVLMEEF